MLSAFERFARKDSHLIVGLMSGTSVDGADAAVCRIEGHGRGQMKVTVLGGHSEVFEAPLRARILDACTAKGGSSAELCELNFILGEVFAHAAKNAIQACELSLHDIDLIGSHGQTIAHYPPRCGHAGIRKGSTLQIGEAAVIAERTGLPVVSNFRSRDMAAGGQGAPLVPFADWLLFSSETEHRVALNIGGIANISWMPAGCAKEQVVAFDTGPGNMVLDALAEKISGGKLAFDAGGALARQGRVDAGLLNELLANDYFHRTPPKSTGREEFGGDFARALFDNGIARGLNPNAILATATQLTATSIALGMQSVRGGKHSALKIFAAGGGVRNDCLMAMLRDQLNDAEILPTESAGIPAQYRECAAFAILARETMLGRPSNLPHATGAHGPRILGDITPG